jgi:tetratricopeptide (TPR) repeat protein
MVKSFFSSVFCFWQQSYRVTQTLGLVLTVLLLVPLECDAQATKARRAERVLRPRTELSGVRFDAGSVFTEQLAGKEVHSFTITARAGQFIRVTVEQQGIDVEVTLVSRNGDAVVTVNNANGTRGIEVVSFLASHDENFHINIKSTEPAPRPAHYRLSFAEQRDSVELDVKRINGDRLVSAGESLRGQEAYKEALAKYQEAYQYYLEAGDKPGAALAVLDMGKANYFLLDMERAIGNYKTAMDLFAADNVRLDRGVSLLYIGMAKLFLGLNSEALTDYGAALEIFNNEDDQRYYSFALNEIGRAYYLQGDANKALEYYNRALPIRQELNDRKGESFTLVSIGRVYSNVFGSDTLARDYYQRALTLQRDIGNRRLIAQTLGDIGRLSYKIGDYTTALSNYTDALRAAKDGDPSVGAEILMYIGLVYSAWGRHREAIDRYYSEALRLQQDRDPIGFARTRQHVGRSYAALGEDDKALEHFNGALKVWQEVLHRTAEAETRYQIALIENKRGRLVEACDQIKMALPAIENLRTGIVNRALRANYFGSVQNYYELYIDSLMRLSRQTGDKKYEAIALDISERKRARALLDVLVESDVDLRRHAPDPELLKKESLIQQELSVQSLRQITGEHLTIEQARKIELLIAALHEVDAEIRIKNPRYAALTRTSPPSLAQIQTDLLGRDQMLLEYSLGDERSYLWTVTPTSMKSYILPGRSEIERAVTRLMGFLTARNVSNDGATESAEKLRLEKADAGYLTAAASLAQVLGLDRATTESSVSRLLIVADGELQYLPFAALLVPAKGVHRYESKHVRPQFDYPDNLLPLLVSYEIEEPQSMSVAAELKRERVGSLPASGKTIAVVADPVFSRYDERCCVRRRTSAATSKNATVPLLLKQRSVSPQERNKGRTMDQATDTMNWRGHVERLAFTGREAAEIFKLVSPEEQLQATGFEANLGLLTSGSGLSSYRIVHFATHGWLSPDYPELSGILLSLVDEQGRPQNGILQMHQIFGLRLSAELIVLSACETAIGKKIKGEGLNGMSSGFMYAGAKRVIASLWKVNDGSTSELMNYFYGGLNLRQGVNFSHTRPAAALRAAQLKMMEKPLWRHPYYWAAFIIQGDSG